MLIPTIMALITELGSEAAKRIFVAAWKRIARKDADSLEQALKEEIDRIWGEKAEKKIEEISRQLLNNPESLNQISLVISGLQGDLRNTIISALESWEKRIEKRLMELREEIGYATKIETQEDLKEILKNKGYTTIEGKIVPRIVEINGKKLLAEEYEALKQIAKQTQKPLQEILKETKTTTKQGIETLIGINLSWMELEKIDLDPLIKLKNLRYLYLHGNSLSSINLGPLRDHKGLKICVDPKVKLRNAKVKRTYKGSWYCYRVV